MNISLCVSKIYMLVILLVILLVIALVANATKLVHVSNVLRNLRYSIYLCA